jgi:hypothetical protein
MVNNRESGERMKKEKKKRGNEAKSTIGKDKNTTPALRRYTSNRTALKTKNKTGTNSFPINHLGEK